jgi:carbonic anhydrase/acetyltransferase-like protein (isoleucine patch superfamily)
MTSSLPFLHCLPYANASPDIDGVPRAARPGHALIGRLTLGRDAWLGAGAVIRADGHFVRAGDALHLGRGATVHIAHDRFPSLIGDRVVVGRNAVVHACTLGDDCVIDDDCVVLDGSVLGPGCVLEPGSIVFPRSELNGGWLYAGAPAKPVRELQSGELAERAAALRERNEGAASDWPGDGDAPALDDGVFVASTAWLAGHVIAAAGSSVWYGCRLDARHGEIVLGARSNVQDNSVLDAGHDGIRIGADTTIGHNVGLARGCVVGDHCLVGIGSRLAPGTLVADDCFIAAGARTEPGQRLDGGFLWGGVPARKLTALDDRKRDIVRLTIPVYQGYAQELQRAQRQVRC